MSARAPWTAALLDEIAAEPRLLVVLDFDGTLVQVRARPGLARLDAAGRATLRRIGARAAVAMMSGRSVADLRARVGVPGLLYGGVFGLEIAGPGWSYVHPKARAMKPTLAALARALSRLFADVPGVAVEDKRVGVCVHYRAVSPGRRREFERRLAHARAAAPRGLLWRRGRRAWEILPRTDWDKGAAVKLLRRHLGRPRLLVVGDERFDEPMLRAAQGRGWGLRVGRGLTQARRRLKNPAAVRRFLRGLADRLVRRRA